MRAADQTAAADVSLLSAAPPHKYLTQTCQVKKYELRETLILMQEIIC